MSELSNTIQLIGRLGAKPETRQAGSSEVVTASLATSYTYIKNDQKVEQTEWHDLEIWGKRGAAFRDYTDKGHRIAVKGRLIYDEWEGQDGKKQRRAKIRVSEFMFLQDKGDHIQENGRTYAQPNPATQTESQPSDDLPF